MKLVSLRIPGGWQVQKNSFYDIEPNFTRDNLSMSAMFVEDIAGFAQVSFPDDSAENQGYAIDLSWQPDRDPLGNYVLTLLGENWDDVVRVFTSRDRIEVREEIERWFDLVSRSRDRQHLELTLNKRQYLGNKCD